MTMQKYIIGYTAMKPNDFILNSDYIALSTVSTTTKQVTFPGGTIEYQTISIPFVEKTIEISVPQIDRAGFQYLLSTDGVKWIPSNQLSFDFNSAITGYLVVSRVNAADKYTLKITMLAANHSGATASYPAKTFWIKEAAITAPDME